MTLSRLVPGLYRILRLHKWSAVPGFDRLYLAAFYAYKRFVEDPFALLVQRHPELFRGGDVIDVGANVGYTACVFARAVDSGFHVYAFEPEPSNFRRLRGVVARRNLDNVVPVQSAVSDDTGEGDLVLNPHHPGDHHLRRQGESGPAIRVPVVSLDAFVRDAAVTAVKFVKIDVQGGELAVCRGMSALLDASEGIAVAFECASDSADTPELLSFYRTRGFELRVLTRDLDLPEVSSDVLRRESRRRGGYADILATRRGSDRC